MSSREVIENKISAVKKYLEILERYKKFSVEEIIIDIDVKGALERYLYLAVQASIDLADAVIAYKKLRKPTTMSECFYILEEEHFIDVELREKLVGMVGFRNVMARDYEDVNYDIVYNILHNRLSDIEEFIQEMEKI